METVKECQKGGRINIFYLFLKIFLFAILILILQCSHNNCTRSLNEDEENILEKIFYLRDKRTLTEIGQDVLRGCNELNPMEKNVEISKNRIFSEVGIDIIPGYNDEDAYGKSFDSKDKKLFTGIGVKFTQGNEKENKELLEEKVLELLNDKKFISSCDLRFPSEFHNEKILGKNFIPKHRRYFSDVGVKFLQEKTNGKPKEIAEMVDSKKEKILPQITLGILSANEEEIGKMITEKTLNLIKEEKIPPRHVDDYISRHREHVLKLSGILENEEKRREYVRNVIKEYYENTDVETSASADEEENSPEETEVKEIEVKKNDLQNKKKKKNMYKNVLKKIKKKCKYRSLFSKTIAAILVTCLSPVILLISIYIGMHLSFSKFFGEYIFIHRSGRL
ncbi:Plasmodium exported protein, unknown function [Plasmodium ovale]|uniref:Uncharacterized protein n=1 Tax=Plasmodium ovale TaxID=36330 RepID=A0A1C3KMX7_PLAOA|nr:Plasmodium exported protein, unknown function [Plasmodium ovale]